MTFLLIILFLIMAIAYMVSSNKHKEQEYIERGMTLDEIKEHRAQLARRRAFETKAKIVGVIVIAIIAYATYKG